MKKGNNIQPPAPPTQPETIVIECSARNSIRTSDSFDEWEVSIPPVELRQGDEIGVNQSFLEARGTATEILEFSSSGLDQNNKQRIYFEYYCSDDGTNDKNKGRDWLYFGAGSGTGADPALHETAKTYKPCKAIRYDTLLEESLINANGNEFQRTINDKTYQSAFPTDLDPRVANAYSINYKEDYNVPGIFNSINTINELNTVINEPYLGPCNTVDLDAQEKSLTFTDSIINLDALEYWEMELHVGIDERVELKTPYLAGQQNTNYISSIPAGTIIWIDWMPKRRQHSFYGGQPGAQKVDEAYQNYAEYTELSHRVGPLCGHFLVTANNISSNFVDSGHNDAGTIKQFGYNGQTAISTYFTKVNPDGSPNSFIPRIDLVNATYSLTSNTGVPRLYCNPWTTQSKENLLNPDGTPKLLEVDPMPVNLVIRKSPYYIGSVKLQLNQNLPARLACMPICKNDGGTQHPTRFDAVEDAKIDELFPKIIGNPNDDIPLYLGSHHKQNLEESGSAWTFASQNSKKPFNALGTEDQPICFLKNYFSVNNYKPLGYDNEYFLKIDMVSSSTSLMINVLLNANSFQRLKNCAHNIVVLGRGTNNEEWIRTGRIMGITDETSNPSNAPTRMTVEVLARNINENHMNFTAGGPTNFDPNNPVGWVHPSAGDAWAYYAHPANTTKLEWWDWREGKTLNLELTQQFFQYQSRGMPILKNCGYWGTNELNTEGFPSTYNDKSLYTNELKQIYDFGYTYFLYHKRTHLNNPGVQPNQLPDNDFLDINTDPTWFLNSGRLTQNKGIWMFPLVDSFKGDSDIQQVSYGNPENPKLTLQVLNSSNSPNASTTAHSFTARFNPHIPIYDMNFDFELNRTKMDTQTIYERNFYIWIPDIFSVASLNRWSNQGINLYCGYVPLINQITLETSKDYLTPTDLSNFWTETLHKSTDIHNLYDGSVIPNSRNRGILQNPLLMPIYGSWGNYNLPHSSGYMTRDYFTFPMCNGFALGSVIFVDGHKMASDWTWSGLNYDDPAPNLAITQRDGFTYYIYPRSKHNLVHLWASDTAYPLPTYTITRNNQSYNGHASSLTGAKVCNANWQWFILDPAGAKTAVSFYPASTSGKQNNPDLSNDIPGTQSNQINNANLSYTAPATNQKGVPAYSVTPGDKFDLVTASADYPFNGQAGFREDAIYRESEPYPLQYYKDDTYEQYLKFSQYVGCDNMTLTYNPNFSAFEFQFLHQPFATTYQLNGGQGSGGDNAVRIFSNIPSEIINWEKYSGINVRNWATPDIPKGTFTYKEIQTRPAFLDVAYPNGLNPETDLDLVGDRFMNKLGFTQKQYNPKTGTIVKGVEGMNKTVNFPHLFTYEPSGTTGADTDVADAIINTSFSAEDNPNSDARGGLGQLIYYPSSADAQSNQIRHITSGNTNVPSGVRYDWSYTLYGQRGGLKTNNHNKSMGFPNIVGTPQVEDILTFPITLNPDGEQRTGYTIEIGSSPLRAVNLPIKLTDGYYYILCPDLIDDPQFYISNNNGSVIPAIAIVSKTYVSGDFYTTFQSPIRFYCKRNQILTKIKVQIRNSSMGVPSNLGANSSVIFNINRFNPTVQNPPLDIGSQQAVDYSILKAQNRIRQRNPTAQSTLQDIASLVGNVLQDPQDDQADYIDALQERINQYDIRGMNPVERREFFTQTEEGGAIAREIAHVTALNDSYTQTEATPDPLVSEIQTQTDILPIAEGGTQTRPEGGGRGTQTRPEEGGIATQTPTIEQQEVETQTGLQRLRTAITQTVIPPQLANALTQTGAGLGPVLSDAITQTGQDPSYNFLRDQQIETDRLMNAIAVSARNSYEQQVATLNVNRQSQQQEVLDKYAGMTGSRYVEDRRRLRGGRATRVAERLRKADLENLVGERDIDVSKLSQQERYSLENQFVGRDEAREGLRQGDAQKEEEREEEARQQERVRQIRFVKTPAQERREEEERGGGAVPPP